MVVGGAPAPTGLDPAAVEAVRTLVEAGARAKTAAKVVSDLTGAPANALYREVPPNPKGLPLTFRFARPRWRAKCIKGLDLNSVPIMPASMWVSTWQW